MRDIDFATQAALQSRTLMARNFIWIGGADWNTGVLNYMGFWNDVGTVSAAVIDAETQTEVSRTFIGAGTLIAIDDIPLTSDVTIRNVNVTLSQIDAAVAQAARGYNLKGGPVQIYRGMFDPATRNLVAPAIARFVGFVDQCVITDPAAGNDGAIALTLASHTRELTRASAAKRSNQDQKRRASGDTFFQFADVMQNVEIFWGQNKGKVPTSSSAIGGGSSSHGGGNHGGRTQLV